MKCPNCGNVYNDDYEQLCPNCGADHDGCDPEYFAEEEAE